VFFLFYWVGLAILAGLATRPVRIFTLALGATLLLWGLDGLVQLVFGVDLIGVPRAASGRLFGIFGDNQRLGVTLGVMMPLAFLPLVERKPLLAMLAFAFLTFIVSLVGGARRDGLRTPGGRRSALRAARLALSAGARRRGSGGDRQRHFHLADPY
jgi:hypothetical protein